MARATSPSIGSTPRRRRSRSASSPAASPRCSRHSAATGSTRMGDDALAASALLAPDSPCQALCGLLRGVSEQLRGDAAAARHHLEAAARLAAVPAPQVQALCLTQLALIALEDEDSEGAARLITRARSQVAPLRARALSDERRSSWPSRRSSTRSADASTEAHDDAAEARRAARAARRRRALVRARGADRARPRRAAPQRRQRGADAAGGGRAASTTGCRRRSRSAAGCAPPKPTSRRSRARPARCRRR